MPRFLYLGTAGSDDRTRAGFPFNFAMGAQGADHQPEIFLAGEAVYLMKDTVTDLKGKNAQFINPRVIVEKVAATDKVVSL